MENNQYQTLLFEIDDGVARIVLNRPDVHNAFNDIMIREMTDVFNGLEKYSEVRVAVLTGKGKSFCAGADLNWMRRVKDYSYEDNLHESLELSNMLYSIYSSPKPTVARVNGAAIGGGTGLVAVCDIAIAASTAKFSFSEVKIGLIPACISPYVVKKCGEGRCREFFLTGERMTADLSSGPEAIARCKELLRNVPLMTYDEVKKYTAEVIARIRISEEGQEGMAAFLEKRKPKWFNDSGG